MADEAPEEAGGSVLKKWGPLAAIVLLAQTVVCFAIVWFIFKGNAPEPQQESLIPDEAVQQRGGTTRERTRLPFLYATDELKSITANPAGTNALRFVMFTVKLGLVATDHDKDPRKSDVTNELADSEAVIRIGEYDSLIKSIIVRIVRLRTVDQLDGERLEQVQEEIKHQVNQDVMQKLFPFPDPEEKNTIEVRIEDVIFSEIIIQ
jgi:flagellar basal body-associated protein FliL